MEKYNERKNTNATRALELPYLFYSTPNPTPLHVMIISGLGGSLINIRTTRPPLRVSNVYSIQCCKQGLMTVHALADAVSTKL